MSECPADCCPHEGAGLDDGCPGDLPYAPLRERIALLRGCRLLPVAKIAALTRADRQTISQLLYEIADEASPGVSGWRPARQAVRDEWFPVGHQLTADLVSDLYQGWGLGLSHIGLLTGRPSSAVGAVLRAKGIRLRRARETSPFLRRFRQRDA